MMMVAEDILSSILPGDQDRKRSLTGYVFLVNGNQRLEGYVLQPVVALSTIGVKFIALTKTMKAVIWFKGLLLNKLKHFGRIGLVYYDS